MEALPAAVAGPAPPHMEGAMNTTLLRWPRTAACVVILSALVVSCAPTASPTALAPTVRPSPTVAAATSGSPSATLVALPTIPIPTAIPTAAPRAVTPAAGTGFLDGVYVGEAYKLIFVSGVFTLTTVVGQEWAWGNYLVAGNVISFTEQDVEPECQPSQNQFTYRWSFDGKALGLAVVADPCSARQYFLPSNIWTYQAAKP
jgi:hypothetical protein